MKRLHLLTFAGLLVASATACGTTEPALGGAPRTATTGATTSTSSASSGPVTITDARGTQVRLNAPATRVVALEWGEAEMLVSLGVMPVGVADVKGYATWDTAGPLAADVKDVGTRAEPSVDAVVALDPDLVVMEAARDAKLVTQLEKFVPVLVTTGADATDELGRLRTDFTRIATATGKTAEATKVLADLDAAIADGKAKIAAAGNAGAKFTMADGWRQGSAISVRMFAKGSLVSELGTALGLENAWRGKGDEMWGLATTDVEGLTALDDQDLTFFYNASDGDDVFADGLATNAIWKSLRFVEDGNTKQLPAGMWTFGGPLSCRQFIDTFVATFAS